MMGTELPPNARADATSHTNKHIENRRTKSTFPSCYALYTRIWQRTKSFGASIAQHTKVEDEGLVAQPCGSLGRLGG